MGVAKRKSEPTEDLGGEILRLRGQIEAFIDAKVLQMKQSASGRDLPADTLRMMLTHGSGCWCQIALNVMAGE
jgi:hypothetical protein